MFLEDKGNGEVQEASFEGFLAFVEKQPSYKGYSYWNFATCPCAQYAASIGKMEEWRGPDPRDWRQSRLPKIWQRLDELVALTVEGANTFGALARYLRHNRASQDVSPGENR
jgi:hypothetical protein